MFRVFQLQFLTGLLIPALMCSLLGGQVGVSAQEEVCYVGYIMDTYCISRGRLLDNPSKSALGNPDIHSVHCLVDVPECAHSTYQVLALDANSNGEHCRAYQLDDAGRAMAITLARQEGVCSTCTGAGTLVKGFSATVIGTATSTGSSDEPVKLAVTQVLSASVGCEGAATVPAVFDCSQGWDQPYQRAHGSLMLIGWGLLLPSGVIIARLLKHRANALWFKCHRAIQCTGLVFVFTGWIIALARFDVFFDGASKGFGSSYAHGVVGMMVMVLGLLQPINAFFRPHPEPKSAKRTAWEIWHKGSGYSAVVLGLMAIFMGTKKVSTPDDKDSFQGAFFGFLAVLVALIVGLVMDKRRSSVKAQEVAHASTE